MKLFGQIVRTLVNIVQVPVDIVKDGGVCTKGELDPYTTARLRKIAEDAEEKP
jgi:hypothetical protein